MSGEPGGEWIDRERFLAVARDCDWTPSELARFYCDGTAQELERMRAAVSARQSEELARVAHGSVGAAATCGIDGMAELFRPLEEAAWAGRMDGASAALDRAATRLSRIRQALAVDGEPGGDGASR